MSDANYSDTTNEEKNSSTTIKSEQPSFFTSLSSQLIYLIIVIIVGGIMLYSSKVSQSGLLPVNISCEPFTSFSTRVIDEVVLNIDVVKMKEGNQSTKISFPYESNNNVICNSFLGVSFLKLWVEGEDSNTFTRYIGTIWQCLYAYAFSLYNTFYSILATYFTESMIIFLGPFILPYVSILYAIILSFYGFILFFTKFYMLFGEKDMCPVKENENGMSTSYVIWKDSDDALYKNFNWFFCILFGIILICCFFYLFLISIALTFVSMLTAIILPLLLNAKVITSKNEKTEYTFFNTLENIFKYKINIIMYIISYYILIDSYNSIGSYGVFIAIVSFIFIYIFYPEIYKKHTPSIDSNASTKGLVNIQPNNSMCQKTPSPTAEERSNLTCSNETIVNDNSRSWLEWLIGSDDDTLADDENNDVTDINLSMKNSMNIPIAKSTLIDKTLNGNISNHQTTPISASTTEIKNTPGNSVSKNGDKTDKTFTNIQSGGNRTKKTINFNNI